MNKHDKGLTIAGPKEPEQITVEVVTTSENVMDILFCTDIVNGYRAIAELAKGSGVDASGQPFIRGKIVQIHSVPVQLHSNLSLQPQMKTCLMVLSERCMPVKLGDSHPNM